MAWEVWYLEIKNKTGTEIVYQDSTFLFGTDTLGSIFTDITELSWMTAVSDEINWTAYDNSKSLIEVYDEYQDAHWAGHIVLYDVTPEPTPTPSTNKVIKKDYAW